MKKPRSRFVMPPESIVRYHQQLKELTESGRELARLLHNSVVPVENMCPVGGIAAPNYIGLAHALQTNAAHRSMVYQLLENMRKGM